MRFYLFLIGISAGLVTLAILLRRYHPEEGASNSRVMLTTLFVAPTSVMLGLVILIFHLTRPWTFWKLMFHYSFTSVMSMGGDAVPGLHGSAGGLVGADLP
ncbi:Formate-dependent nitrite reductase, membrane component [Serratia fonticola]|uniref:Formate-dependent nitrite reductase, membrane component n=1 Tax=Serratia fonticola TaxID=47917 RepID=A0A4U9WEY7_SERFO|nr:Formate-dependent nitrite reductase, membrane component [Serratia fonticola]